MKLYFTLLLIFISSFIVSQENYVVALSLDWFRYDYIKKHNTKNIASIAKKGVRVKYIIPVNPTKKNPNNYTIATDLNFDNNSIVKKSFYESDLKKRYNVFITELRKKIFKGVNCDKQMSAFFVAIRNTFKQNYRQNTIRSI